MPNTTTTTTEPPAVEIVAQHRLREIVGAAVIGCMLLAMAMVGLGGPGGAGTPLRSTDNEAPGLALTPPVPPTTAPGPGLVSTATR